MGITQFLDLGSGLPSAGHVHEVARRFEGVEPGTDRWEFRCECGAPDCREAVSLTLAEYEAQRAGGEPVVAPGHRRRA